MRLVDVLLRQGHLSEQALVDAVMTGDRPPHLDRCGICAERAVEMNRWLEGVRDVVVEAADAAFPAERLAVQQAQIQRRLELLDEPARVIAFPGQARSDSREAGRRLVAPAWVGVAAAAGLVIGVIGGLAAGRIEKTPAVLVQVPAAAPVAPTTDSTDVLTASLWIDFDALDAFTPAQLGAMNEATPRSSLIMARR
jgi:hypothetical protein